MRENNKINETNWALIEAMAQKLCPDEFDLASRSDLNYIEQQVVEGNVISFENDGGDMHSYELYIATLTLVVSTLQLVVSFWSAYHQMFKEKNKDDKPTDVVGLMMDNEEMRPKISPDSRNYLLEQRDKINHLLSELDEKEEMEKQDEGDSQE